jgi:hypothetical protein
MDTHKSNSVWQYTAPFLNCFLRVISGHDGQLFAGFSQGFRDSGLPVSCQSLSVIRSSELENRAPDQDGRKGVRSFANVKSVCFDSGVWRVAIFIFVRRPSLTYSFPTNAKSGV